MAEGRDMNAAARSGRSRVASLSDRPLPEWAATGYSTTRDRVDAGTCLGWCGKPAPEGGSLCDACRRLRLSIRAATVFSKAPASHRKGVAYLASQGHRVKIGYTGKKMATRLSGLRSKYGRDVAILHAIKTDAAAWLEAALHLLFEDRHDDEEWFLLSGDDVRRLKRLDCIDIGQHDRLREAFPRRFAASRLPTLLADIQADLEQRLRLLPASRAKP